MTGFYPTDAEPVIIGVRHHSPACARLVAQKIRALRPAYVLIEGPADFNDKLDELFLPHHLPLAIYSFLSSDNTYRASWTPFAEHSPEWQALITGREVGAQVRFIDLPAWDDAFAHIANRYADVNDETEANHAAAYEEALCTKLSVDNRDALWDKLFENEMPADVLDESLAAYFEHLRPLEAVAKDSEGTIFEPAVLRRTSCTGALLGPNLDPSEPFATSSLEGAEKDVGSPGNQAREQMMVRWIAWAMGRNEGAVVVICGGYHAPVLRQAWHIIDKESFALEQGDVLQPPTIPLPDCATPSLHFGSYLVPYTFKRLDSFTGYASGMPSPYFYQLVWEKGMSETGAAVLQLVAERLRKKKLPVSTADLIAAHAHAEALARVRGNAFASRCDWLDALAASLIKDALDTPLPWTYRGPIRCGTDAMLVEIMDVLAGDIVGKLAPSTPQPPLVHAVEMELALNGIAVPSHITLDLLKPSDRTKSRLLHRLSLLALPGIVRQSGPNLALSGERREAWSVQAPWEQRAVLIEAAMYGATLESAACNKLEEDLRQAGRAHGESRIAQLAEGLNRAAFAGLAKMSETILTELELAIASEPSFEALGTALSILHTLLRHGHSVEMAGAPVLCTVVASIFDRALWLLEAMGPVPTVDLKSHVTAFLALRQVARDALHNTLHNALQNDETPSYAETKLKIEPQRALAVWHRKLIDERAAPVSRGAALGALVSLNAGKHFSESDNTTQEGVAKALTLLGDLLPGQIGDALTGLLALARDQLTQDKQFIVGLDTMVAALDDADFVLALPAMRNAFSWLPPRERGVLADAVLVLHHVDHLSQRTLTGQFAGAGPEELAKAVLLEQAAIHKLASWGITL